QLAADDVGVVRQALVSRHDRLQHALSVEASAVGSGGTAERTLAELHVQLTRVAPATDLHRDRRARLQARDDGTEVVGTRDRRVDPLGDPVAAAAVAGDLEGLGAVAAANAGLRGRAARGDGLPPRPL